MYNRSLSRANVARFLVLMSGAVTPLAFADTLIPPPGYYAEIQYGSVTARSCEPAPAPFTGVMDFPSKYEGSGKSRDTLNDVADARYKTLTKPINDMEKGATRLVEQYMAGGSTQTLTCVLAWYSTWANARALLGPAAGHTGKSQRKWALASLSGAWLRLKFSRSQPLAAHARQAATIEHWLGTVATQVTHEWNENDPLDKINNHYYWAAWSVMATSIITDRRDLFNWATKMYTIFAQQVDAEGFLPNELKRQTRAGSYQIYAVTPVAMLAAFGKANHVNLAGEGNNALQRAAARAIIADDDPGQFEAKTGRAQVPATTNGQQSGNAWLEPYCWTVQCLPPVAEKLLRLRPLRNTRLGGNVSDVFAHPKLVTTTQGDELPHDR